MIPLLLVVMKISKNAIDGLDPTVSYDEVVILLAINGIVASLSYILFPYLWRS
jgi:heme exporter protein B